MTTYRAAARAACRFHILPTPLCSPSPPIHQPAATISTCLLQLRSTVMTVCKAMGLRQARACPTINPSPRCSNIARPCHSTSINSNSSSRLRTCTMHRGSMPTRSSCHSPQTVTRCDFVLTCCRLLCQNWSIASCWHIKCGLSVLITLSLPGLAASAGLVTNAMVA